MKINRLWAAFLLGSLYAPAAFALTPVKDSSEDLFWTDPMTIHDYKKDSDFHNVAVSVMALTELEFIKLGDGMLNLSLRNKKSPISQSLDSLEYAYSKLPRIEPVRRFGQLFDALQLRQLSLSDARLIGTFLVGDGVGGVTPLMQVRVYKLVVLVEDVIYDLDKAVMSPINWGASSLRGEPVRIKSLAYAADGLGYCRWKLSLGLKQLNREIVQMSSKLVTGLEKPHNALIRRKRKKENANVRIYSKMPLEVFQANRSYFTGKRKAEFVGTLNDWYDRIYQNPGLFPDSVKSGELSSPEVFPVQDRDTDVIVETKYSVWEKTPKGLKKYVITFDELVEFVRRYKPSPSPR